MKPLGLIGMVGLAACVVTDMAGATTLPPQREPVTLVKMMPVLPAAAATNSERDYFQAPTVNRSGLDGRWAWCPTATHRPNGVAHSVLCH